MYIKKMECVATIWTLGPLHLKEKTIQKKKRKEKKVNIKDRWGLIKQGDLNYRSIVIGLISKLLFDHVTIVIELHLGRWRPGIQLTLLFLIFLVRYQLLVLIPQKVVVDLTTLSPDVVEDLFNTFVIAIIISCVVILWGLVLLGLFELINSLLLSLQNSGFLGGNLAFNSLTESLLSCLNFFL